VTSLSFPGRSQRAFTSRPLWLLEHRYFHHVDLAFVFVHMSAEFDVVPHMIFQSLRIDYFPGFSAIICDKCDFVAVRFHGAPDVRQLRLLLILRSILRFSLNEDWNSEDCYRKCYYCR
jgi:hypothetical protein